MGTSLIYFLSYHSFLKSDRKSAKMCQIDSTINFIYKLVKSTCANSHKKKNLKIRITSLSGNEWSSKVQLKVNELLKENLLFLFFLY